MEEEEEEEEEGKKEKEEEEEEEEEGKEEKIVTPDDKNIPACHAALDSPKSAECTRHNVPVHISLSAHLFQFMLHAVFFIFFPLLHHLHRIRFRSRKQIIFFSSVVETWCRRHWSLVLAPPSLDRRAFGQHDRALDLCTPVAWWSSPCWHAHAGSSSNHVFFSSM
jgi:hypothetical protein